MYKFEHEAIPFGSKLVMISKDSKHLLAITADNDLISWDLKTGELEKGSRAHRCLPVALSNTSMLCPIYKQNTLSDVTVNFKLSAKPTPGYVFDNEIKLINSMSSWHQ
jgi:hypothetical protein